MNATGTETAMELNRTVHPKDQMYGTGSERYWTVGANALDQIRGSATAAGVEPRSILDYGCGYGRVGRHLRAAYPGAEIHFADVMKPATEFCAEQFGGTALPVPPAIADVSLPRRYDIIWAGSVATHISEERARDMMRLFADGLEEGGVAVWTTHGRYLRRVFESGKWPYLLETDQFRAILDQEEAGGYGYTDYGHMKNYGISVCSLQWLIGEMERIGQVRIVMAHERGWDNHQDVVAMQRRPV